MPEQENIFLQAQKLTEIPPLHLSFLKGEVQLSENNRSMILRWTQKVKKYNTPIFVNSYASEPTGLRDLTQGTARHEALRIAINRGLRAKNFLENCGIDQSRLILRAPGPEQPNPEANTSSKINDGITITTRRD